MLWTSQICLCKNQPKADKLDTFNEGKGDFNGLSM